MRSANKVAEKSRSPSLLSIVFVAAFAAYPVLVYFGLLYFSTAWVAVWLLVIAAVRLVVGMLGIAPALSGKSTLFICACIVVLALLSIVLDSSEYVLYTPVLINATLLSVFLYSLLSPPTMIERFARLQDPDLPPSGVAYARKVTIVWSVFFVLNGSIALYTSLFTSIETWTLYNGGIAYVLIGTLFVGEWLYRRFVIRSHAR